MLVFQEGGKLEYPGKNPGTRRKPTTNSTGIQCGTRPESNPGYIGGRQALSPLPQLCYPTNSSNISKNQC